MSSYAYDPDRGALITVWRTPSGGTCSRDLVTGPAIDTAAAEELTRALGELEAAIWRVYDRPAHEATGDDSEEDVRAAEQEALTRVAAAVRQPRRADDAYGLTVSFVAVDERANQVGRALDGLPQQWREVVADDLEEEADAVRRASLGDYAGRAVQAVWRDRLEVAPSQLTAALDALQGTDDPMSHVGQLAGDVGVMAAAAAGVLLTAAAEATAAVWGGEPERVFLEADNIEAVSVEVPTTVAAGIRHGIDPGDVIVSLVSDALTVRDGWVPDLDALAVRVADAEERAAPLESQWPGTMEALREEASRLTLPDTARPAADLFEHLADGLNATRVLYAEAMLERHPSGSYDDDEQAADQARMQQWQARWVADTAARLAAWRADAR